MTQLEAGVWTRLTLFTDYGAHKAAFFLDDRLLAERVDFPYAAGAYSAVYMRSQTGTAAMDELSVTQGIPSGLTGDQDRDGIPDAQEIHNYGSLGVKPFGTVFRFR